MNWVILLAGGAGTRLADESLRRYGYARPKQFCDFGGGTLLELTLYRARRFAPDRRIVVITTRQHRRDACPIMTRHPRVCHLEQPRNRDTTPGLLLPLMHIRALDPEATVIVMPTDHAVADEVVFASTVEHALEVVENHADAIALLAAEPSGLDADYGWLVPAAGPAVSSDERWPPVAAFREKPLCDEIPRLRAQGALLNTFVFAARAATLEDAFQRWAPQYLEGILATHRDPALLEVTFDVLPNSNFSRDVLQRMPGQLRIVPLPKSAGWSDIGTPERLANARWRPEDKVQAAIARAVDAAGARRDLRA